MLSPFYFISSFLLCFTQLFFRFLLLPNFCLLFHILLSLPFVLFLWHQATKSMTRLSKLCARFLGAFQSLIWCYLNYFWCYFRELQQEKTCSIETITILSIVNIAAIFVFDDTVIVVVSNDCHHVRLYVCFVMSSYLHVSHLSYLSCVCSVTYYMIHYRGQRVFHRSRWRHTIDRHD